MCNIAAYVGTKNAAPIVTEMLRLEEGLDAGFYTGISTICNGKLETNKVLGDLRKLEKDCNISSMKGNIAIIHGRTPGGGGQSWAHPYLGKKKDGEARISYVANGTFGKFAPNILNAAPLAEGLIKDGYILETQTDEKMSFPLKLSDGTTVHTSEVFAQAACRHIDNGMSEEEAMLASFKETGGEWVGLMLSKDNPDKIFFLRWNMPMFIAYAPHGVYMASCPLVFPDDAEDVSLIPSQSYGYVDAQGISLKKFTLDGLKVIEADASIRHKAYDTILKELEGGEKKFSEFYSIIGKLFNPDYCAPINAVSYDAVTALYKEGKIKFTTRDIKGMNDTLVAPKIYISLT